MPVEINISEEPASWFSSPIIASHTGRKGAGANLLFEAMGKVLNCEGQCQCNLEEDCSEQYSIRVFCGIPQYEKSSPVIRTNSGHPLDPTES